MANPQPLDASPAEPPRRSLLSLAQRSAGEVKPRFIALLGPNVKVQGHVSFTEGLRIDGAVRGDVSSGDDPGSTLTIGDGGQVQGDIRVVNLIVYGHIQGNVHVTGKLDVREQALITGDVCYHTLEIVPGGVIQGRLIPQPRA